MLVDLHPSYIQKEGKKEYVVLPVDEFTRIKDLLSDYEDLMELRKTKNEEQHEKGYSLDEAKKLLNLD